MGCCESYQIEESTSLKLDTLAEDLRTQNRNYRPLRLALLRFVDEMENINFR